MHMYENKVKNVDFSTTYTIYNIYVRVYVFIVS